MRFAPALTAKSLEKTETLAVIGLSELLSLEFEDSAGDADAGEVGR